MSHNQGDASAGDEPEETLPVAKQAPRAVPALEAGSAVGKIRACLVIMILLTLCGIAAGIMVVVSRNQGGGQPSEILLPILHLAGG